MKSITKMTCSIFTGVLLLVASSIANAVPITLTNPKEQISGNKKVCIYEGHGITRVITVSKSSHCPYSKTFQTD